MFTSSRLAAGLGAHTVFSPSYPRSGIESQLANAAIAERSWCRHSASSLRKAPASSRNPSAWPRQQFPSWQPPASFVLMLRDAGLHMDTGPEGDDLDFWRNLSFSFNDMDDKLPRASQISRASSSSGRTRSTSSPGIPLPQQQQPPPQPSIPFDNFSTFPHNLAPTVPSYEAIATALRTLQDALPYLPRQSTSQPYPSLVQPQHEHQQQQAQPLPLLPQHGQTQPTLEQLISWSTAHQAGGGLQGSSQMQTYDFPSPLPSQSSGSTSVDSSHLASTSAAQGGDVSSPDAEGADPEIGAAEDKRRRNTAASARFRVKKKLKTLNLERTVSDLTGRVTELEQEASDLRRENGWLKEIVMLKSRRPGPDFFAMPGPAASSSGSGLGPEGGGGHDSEDDGEQDRGEGSSKDGTL